MELSVFRVGSHNFWPHVEGMSEVATELEEKFLKVINEVKRSETKLSVFEAFVVKPQQKSDLRMVACSLTGVWADRTKHGAEALFTEGVLV